MEAFKVSPTDRVQQRLVEQISLTFRFHAVEVFKVSSQDMVQRLRPLLRTFLLVLQEEGGLVRGAEAALQFDDVVAIPGDDRERFFPCFSPSSSTE